MNNGEICARHFASRQPIWVRWRSGVITHVEPTTKQPSEDLWIAPSLFDLQVNGYGGIDFQTDGLTLDNLLSATRQLRAAGCGRFLLTLITDEWSKLTNRLRHVRALRSQSDELQSAIAGWHIEGPFLSAEPGFCGAHDPTVMLDPTAKHIQELRAVAGDDPLLLTLAPERPGALEVIALAVSLGMKVSLGHTNASAEVLQRAVQAGATGFTHLGNACPRELDRHDNIIWRVLDTPGLTVSLIPDRIHVSPALFRLVHRALDPVSIYYTTDAMAAAGAPPGRYPLGTLQLEVGADQIVRQPGKTNFAGSALRPIDGIFRAAQMFGCDWQEVWPHFSATPAKLMDLSYELQVQQCADFCLLKLAGENQLVELKVCSRGEFTSWGAQGPR
ncbi:MAG: N-acetylglucosamine-6-phosphate deacetylase [Verrucomicrobia bacterium]|nr:N-acetylglucosamine-6-phosphate deacetylase [Verrucomicrobiota bacterium]